MSRPNLRDRMGFHDGVSRTQFVLVCLAVVLMIPAYGVMLFADWLEARGGS